MNDLTVGKVGKQILKFAIPMLIGNIFQQLQHIINLVIVGKFVGKEALAAVGETLPIIFALISLIIGIATGCTIVISQFFGAKDIGNVKRTIDTMNIFLVIASIIMSVIGIASSEPIFKLIHVPSDILPYALTYLNINLIGIIVLFGFHSTSSILRGLGDSKTPLYFLIISTITNIFLDLLFVVVFKWGIAGAAWATIISQLGAFVTAIIYLNNYHKIIRFSLQNLIFDWKIFKKCLQIGVPTGLQQTFVSIGMVALLRIVNEHSTNVATAYNVATRIDMFAAMPAMNFSMALGAFVGQNIGARKLDRVSQGLLSTFVMSGLLSLVITLSVTIFPRFIMRLFTADENVIQIGTGYLQTVGPFYLVFSTIFVMAGVLRGAGDTLIPMFITLFSLWLVRIPIAYFMSNKFGYVGIWWAIPISWAIGSIFSFIYYRTGRWKLKSIVHSATEA
jgi:putative MATE family efflux protein